MQINDTNYPKAERDLTSTSQEAEILKIADSLLDNTLEDLVVYEEELCLQPEKIKETSPLFLEALKAAISRKRLEEVNQPIHITVLWAMYKETARLVNKSVSEHGEDCIRMKVKQMNWLSSGLGHISYQLIAVDDGCPESPSSADVAQQIIDEEGYQAIAKVVRLQDGIDNKEYINEHFSDLTHTSASRKGGAILYGMHKALRSKVNEEKKHVIVFTDADLSANLTQVGSLVFPIVTENKVASLGQRYGLPKSILVKGDHATTEPDSTQEQVGKLVILFRHFVRKTLMPATSHILDTQAGFKAFDADALKEIIKTTRSFKEIFDIDLIINTGNINDSNSIAVVPILFTEDFALTNFPSLKPGENHLNMVKQIIGIYDEFVANDHPADEWHVEFLKSLDLDRFIRLINNFRDHEDERMNQLLFDVSWSLETLKTYTKE